jgi:hypothetical protein
MRGVALVLCVALLQAQGTTDPAARWKPIEFLLGKWTAQGGGSSTGQGTGDFSFELDINKQIVTRRNFAAYTSGPEAGSRHDDLMIIYSEDAGKSLKAIYFDSEGHVIHYDVRSPAPNVAAFESSGYRLTYRLEGKTLAGKFEVGGKTYLDWTSVRK